MPPRPNAPAASRDDLPYDLVFDLAYQLEQRDDPLTSMWTLSNLAQHAPGVEVVRFDHDDPLDRSQAMGIAWVGSLAESGMVDPGRRTALVRQAAATLGKLLDLVQEWEIEAGTSVIQSHRLRIGFPLPAGAGLATKAR